MKKDKKNKKGKKKKRDMDKKFKWKKVYPVKGQPHTKNLYDKLVIDASITKPGQLTQINNTP